MIGWMITITLISAGCAIGAFGVAVYHATHFEKCRGHCPPEGRRK